MMRRAYNVQANTAPGINTPAPATQWGGFSYGARDAARDYAGATLPGYDIVSGYMMAPGLWRFEGVCHAAGLAFTVGSINAEVAA